MNTENLFFFVLRQLGRISSKSFEIFYFYARVYHKIATQRISAVKILRTSFLQSKSLKIYLQ